MTETKKRHRTGMPHLWWTERELNAVRNARTNVAAVKAIAKFAPDRRQTSITAVWAKLKDDMAYEPRNLSKAPAAQQSATLRRRKSEWQNANKLNVIDMESEGLDAKETLDSPTASKWDGVLDSMPEQKTTPETTHVHNPAAIELKTLKRSPYGSGYTATVIFKNMSSRDTMQALAVLIALGDFTDSTKSGDYVD